MASLRQIRRRIKFTQNTQQIVRAMQLVSASKLKRAQERLMQARVVAGYLRELVARLGAARPIVHPLCEQREGGPTALVVFTSDTGLCGAYNANLIHLAEAHLQADRQASMPLVLVGKKGFRYFSKRGYSIVSSHVEFAGRTPRQALDQLTSSLLELF